MKYKVISASSAWDLEVQISKDEYINYKPMLLSQIGDRICLILEKEKQQDWDITTQ